jgi:hypothetical protein
MYIPCLSIESILGNSFARRQFILGFKIVHVAWMKSAEEMVNGPCGLLNDFQCFIPPISARCTELEIR